MKKILDGTFVGQRRDGYGGIWVNGMHLRNPDRSYVTIAQFIEIAGTIYHEASHATAVPAVLKE